MNRKKLVMNIRTDYLELSQKIAVEEFALSTLNLPSKEYILLEMQVLNMKQLKDSYLKRVEYLTNYENVE